MYSLFILFHSFIVFQYKDCLFCYLEVNRRSSYQRISYFCCCCCFHCWNGDFTLTCWGPVVITPSSAREPCWTLDQPTVLPHAKACAPHLSHIPIPSNFCSLVFIESCVWWWESQSVHEVCLNIMPTVIM